jgi:hypothetical protein
MKGAAFIKTVAARAGIAQMALKLKKGMPLILMYHGVSEGREHGRLTNCEGKHIPASVFVSHLRVLRRSHRVISLDEMVDGLLHRQDMQNTVSITFDDGYENNVSVAAPILTDFNMSAAFFLTSGFIGSARCIWTDLLEKSLDMTQCDHVQLPEGTTRIPIKSFNEKRFALTSIKSALKLKPHADLQPAVARLVQQLGLTDFSAEGDYRFMSWSQDSKSARTASPIRFLAGCLLRMPPPRSWKVATKSSGKQGNAVQLSAIRMASRRILISTLSIYAAIISRLHFRPSVGRPL